MPTIGPILAILDPLAIAALCGVLAYAAFCDVRSYTISNRICVAVAVLYAVHGLSGASIDWMWALATGGLVFLAGAALFAAGAIGGGDVKLMAALGLWAGPKLLLPFLAVTSFAGGAVALFVLLRCRLAAQPAGAEMAGSAQAAAVPYGVAIAAGGFYVAFRLMAG